METLNTILLLAILGGITVVGWFLKDAPALFRAIKVEELRGDNELNLQRASFFRQISGAELDKVFKEWTAMITDMNNQVDKVTDGTKGKALLVDMQQKVIMYGSDTTVKILSQTMQHVYGMGKIENRVEVKFGAKKEPVVNYKMMVYIAFLISSLKFDFTGYKIEPMDILKVKINDLDKENNKQAFKKALHEVKTELKNSKINF